MNTNIAKSALILFSVLLGILIIIAVLGGTIRAVPIHNERFEEEDIDVIDEEELKALMGQNNVPQNVPEISNEIKNVSGMDMNVDDVIKENFDEDAHHEKMSNGPPPVPLGGGGFSEYSSTVPMNGGVGGYAHI